MVVGFLGISSFFAFGQAEDVLRDVQAIVVGDVLAGTSGETGMTVGVTAQLRVRRVIVGSLMPGAEIGLSWTYEIRGMWPREDTAAVRPVSGIWLLKAAEGGRWQPLGVTMNVPGAMGGVYLPATEGAIPAEFYYPPDADPHTKVAMELGGAMQAVALREGDRLNPEIVEEGPGRVGYRATVAQVQFGEWTRWLGRLKPEASLPVYQRFAVSPSANLRAVGLSGLLRHGDVAALTALERDVAAIAPTMAGRSLGNELDYRALTKDVASLQTLGRIVLAEQALPALEARAPHAMTYPPRREALPYLAAMLDHPDADQRTSVVMSICTVLNARRDPDMARHCPDRSPLVDPLQEPELVQYWKTWWADQPEAKGAVRPPDRYRVALAAAPAEKRVITTEERLLMLALMYAGSEKRRQTDPKQPESSILPNTTLSPEDSAVAQRVFLAIGRTYEEFQASLVQLKQDLRMQGKPWDREAFDRIAAAGMDAARSGLDQLRRELSSEGWAAAEKTMREMNIR